VELVGEGRNPVTGLMSREYNRKLSLDVGQHMVSAEHVFTEHEETGERRYTFPQTYHWIDEQEGAYLLSQAGFVDVQTFGSYEKSPCTQESPLLMFLARKPFT